MYTDQINEIKTGGKYKCLPKNKFSEICAEDQEGKYRSKDSCVNDCEGLYIREQLIKGNLYYETSKFYQFIKEIIREEKIDVYIKGGNVIGLKILKMIYDKYKNNEKVFQTHFNEFLELELVKDWDFASYTKNKKITDKYWDELDNIASKHQLVSRASKFILYQTKKPILTEGKALFEISILDDESGGYSGMEIPLTTMKIRVNEYNVKYVFMFARAFLDKKNGFDFDLLKRLTNKISVIMFPSKNGLYDDPNNFDPGKLNPELIDFLNKYKKYDKNMPQFLVTHMQDPFRLLYRLPEKNIPKTRKILAFFKHALSNIKVDWLFDPDFIIKVIEEFTNDFGKKLENEYANGGINRVMEFIDGIYWNRVEIEYKQLLTQYGKTLLNNMLGGLIKAMDNEIDGFDKNNKFFHLLQLVKK